MHIVNKNKILDAYYNEVSLKEKKIIRDHISECNLCAEYSEALHSIENKLDYLPENNPSEIVLTNIMESIEIVPTKAVKLKTTISAAPFFQIAFGLTFILALIYIIEIKLTEMPMWSSFENTWFVQIFGSVSVPILIVMIIGIFITLASAPILIFESRNDNNFI